MHLSENVLEVVGGFLNWMRMHAFVGRHYNPFIFRQPLNLLFHVATLMCAPVIASWESVILDCLLTVFPPSVAIIKYIHLASCLKSKPRFLRFLVAHPHLQLLGGAQPPYVAAVLIRLHHACMSMGLWS